MADSIANGHGKSMAIWFPLKTTATTSPVVDLHFNLWRLDHRKQKAKKSSVLDLLDIGILISRPSDFNSVKFYLPINIERKDIEDLGPKFQNHSIATSIFNERLKVSTDQNNVIVLEGADNVVFCGVFRFPTTGNQISENDLEIDPEHEGTTFTITQTALTDACRTLKPGNKLYFRFRIKIPKVGFGTFVNAAVPHDRWLTSGMDVTEYLDFRLNQARNLHPGIARNLPLATLEPESSPLAEINRVDFLLAVGVTVDVVVGYPEFHKCRLLEKDLWKSYVDEAHLNNGLVVYHWRALSKDKKIIDFNAFVKLRLRLSGLGIIWRYLCFAVLIGVVGNSAYSLFALLGHPLKWLLHLLKP